MLYKQWIKPWINLHTKHGRLFSHGDVDSAVHQRRDCIMFTRHHRNCAKQFKQKSITVTGRPGCKPAPFAPQASSGSTQRFDHRLVCPTEKWTKSGWFQKCSQWEPFHSDLRVKTLMVVSSILEWSELQEHSSGELTQELWSQFSLEGDTDGTEVT